MAPLSPSSHRFPPATSMSSSGPLGAQTPDGDENDNDNDDDDDVDVEPLVDLGDSTAASPAPTLHTPDPHLLLALPDEGTPGRLQRPRRISSPVTPGQGTDKRRLAGRMLSEGAGGDEDAVDDASVTDAGFSTPGRGGDRVRRLSFKKRRAPSRSFASNLGNRASRLLERASFGTLGRTRSQGSPRPSFNEGMDWRAVVGSPMNERPPIPSLIPNANAPPFSNPIPTLPLVVLCITIFGEFCSAGVAGPFMFFMIKDFGVGNGTGPDGTDDEAAVGFWAGITGSVFFFAQFLTSLLWASVAEKHGRRAVLFVSLLGNATTVLIFGMSTNLGMAITARLAQGLFNGAVGVARGAVRDLTDSTNEGRAYAILGFCWGMGGIMGPIMGGLLEHPAENYPGLFGRTELLKTYPYVLPCAISSAIVFAGALLCCFLGYDGGVRTGAIHLPIEKDNVERAVSAAGSIRRKVSKRLSGYFVKGGKRTDGEATPFNLDTRPGSAAYSPLSMARTDTREEVTGTPASQHTVLTRTEDPTLEAHGGRGRHYSFVSRTSARHRGILGEGSAYGYEPRRSVNFGRTFSQSSLSQGLHRRDTGQSIYRDPRRVSFMSTDPYAPDIEDVERREMARQQPQNLNFAQRFLLANDDNVFSITDLWVSAAINNDEGYEYRIEDEEVFDDETEDDRDDDDDYFDRQTLDADDDDPFVGSTPTDLSPLGHRLPGNAVSRRDRLPSASSNSALNAGSRATSRRRSFSPNNARRPSASAGGLGLHVPRPGMMRRTSSTSNRIPSIYANTGLQTPSGGVPTATAPGSPAAGSLGAGGFERDPLSLAPGLGVIEESRPGMRLPSGEVSETSQCTGRAASEATQRQGATAAAAVEEKKPPSPFSLLPLNVIAHFGFIGFISTVFDQVFMSFLVTNYAAGGLQLTAAHYAELIACMAFAQMYFQFRFYPKVGPPQGPLSHLSMYRIGLAAYVPCYLLFPFLRAFLHPHTDFFVMTAMIFFTAIRYFSNVCAFTAITVLINAQTPPHLIPLANGLAQTVSSAARFVGPILGGMVWAYSIEGGPDGRPFPFNYYLGFYTVALLSFIALVHSVVLR